MTERGEKEALITKSRKAEKAEKAAIVFVQIPKSGIFEGNERVN